MLVRGSFARFVTINWYRFNPPLTRIVNFWNLIRTRILIRSGRRTNASMSCKRWPTKRSKARRVLRLWMLAAAVLLVVQAETAAVDKVKELQTRFDQESHGTSKIKILDKLGEAQFLAATQAQKANDFVEIGLICEKYRDNVRTALEVLSKQEPNADKHPDGYRHLELQVRRGIREVDELVLIVPYEVRPPLS